MKDCLRYRVWGLGALAILTIWTPRDGHAVPASPRVLDAARGTPREAGALQNMARYEAAKLLGVDRVYRQFALNLSSIPQGRPASRSILVVLCDFEADAYGPAWHPAASSTPAYFESLFFSDDPNDGVTSLREYYRDSSRGRLLISGHVTSGWLTMPHSYAYYVGSFAGLDFGGYPRSAQKLAEDAMTAAYGDFGSDLRAFDNDGPDGIPHSGDDDGYIDAVCVIHPGVGAEVVAYPNEPYHLWSHEAGIATYSDCPTGVSSPGCLPGMVLGDVRGFLYFVGPEYYDSPGDRAVGTYFHEFAHTIGLVDLYAVQTAGLGLYSLMAYGNYLPIDGSGALASHPANLDAWSRQFLGFETPEIPASPGAHSLPPVSQGGGALKVWQNGQPGSEYFLVENRDQSGADRFLPGHGLLIYHVDDTVIDNLNYPDPHFRVGVVQADGRDDLGTPSGNIGDPGDFFPGSTYNQAWSEATSPSSRAYSGLDTGIRMTDIVPSGAADVTFNLSVSTAPHLEIASYRVGDGDNGFPDPNEHDSLFVSVRNVGTLSGPIAYTLVTTDPYVTVETGTSTSVAVAPGGLAELLTPFITSFGTPSVLPHNVTFTLSWSDGSTSGSTSFLASIGMRAGLSEGFESGAPGWTHGPVEPSTADDWHASQSRAHGGSESMKLGSTNALGVGSNAAQTYASRQDAVLVSPMFQLAPNSQLLFYSWIDAETNGGTGAWDGGRVEVSIDGGMWRPLDVESGYGYVIEARSTAALRGEDAFSGSPQRWRRVVADLSPYRGAARIRFRFSSDDANAPSDFLGNQARYYEGWYVDDVAVIRGLSASVDLNPDVINLRSHARWVTAYIEPSGFSPTDIDVSTVRLAGSVSADPRFARVGDHDTNGVPDLTVKFARQALDPLLHGGLNQLEVSGFLVTGQQFNGSDEVRVIDPPEAHPMATVAPNPLNPGGVLTFSTTGFGPVSIKLFDLRGGLVRTLIEARPIEAGVHEVEVDGRGEGGRPLASGVYFFRVETPGGNATGRIAILK